MILDQIGLTFLALAVIAFAGWFYRRAVREGRIQYGNLFGRKLYVRRDQHPQLFWVAFLPGVLFCAWLIVLATSGHAIRFG